jgi:1A family penicillin-binding protein
LIKLTLLGTLLVSLAAVCALLWSLSHVPLEARPGVGGPSVLVEAANGQPLGRVGPLTDSVARAEFPEILVKAVLSIEDRRFFSHWGIDPWGIIRAAFANWTAGTIVEGGSTITQQLVKLQFTGGERNLNRKIREAFMAAWLDFRLGKDEILSRYLNNVYLGAGAYGMAAAARLYFDKRLAELKLSEAAMLAGLIQAPSRFDPTRNLEAARLRSEIVLDAMQATGAIDANAAAAAKANPAALKLSAQTARAGSWYADWIAKHELPKIAGTVKRTMRVRTTLEPEVQRLAEQVVSNALSGPGTARDASEAALVAIRPDGAVIAMVGGRNYNESQFNRAADAQRQPGSTFKLFVYYAALLNGLSPDSTVDASPITIGKWSPDNYGDQQYGQLTLSQAFAQSVNSAAVRLAMTVGLSKVADAARELGLDAPLSEVPSMALGANEVTLLDLTGAFASVRAGRAKLEPWGIAAFGPDTGALRSLGAPASSARELPQREPLLRLLREVVDRGTGRAAAIDGRNVAGKTGTSQDYRDAWFVGFTDDLVVGVWVGNDDSSPMKGVTGGSLPALIWRRFVSAATPLLGHSKQPVAAQSAEPDTLPACDQNACAVRYNSFRSSDCTYQPYAGPRRLCEIQNRNVDADKSPAARDPGRTPLENKTADNMLSNNRADESRPLEAPDRRPMALGGPYARPAAQAPPRRIDSPPSFGPGVFRGLERLGGY